MFIKLPLGLDVADTQHSSEQNQLNLVCMKPCSTAVLEGFLEKVSAYGRRENASLKEISLKEISLKHNTSDMLIKLVVE